MCEHCGTSGVCAVCGELPVAVEDDTAPLGWDYQGEWHAPNGAEFSALNSAPAENYTVNAFDGVATSAVLTTDPLQRLSAYRRGQVAAGLQNAGDVAYAIAQISRLLASASVRVQDAARRALDALERVEERLK